MKNTKHIYISLLLLSYRVFPVSVIVGITYSRSIAESCRQVLLNLCFSNLQFSDSECAKKALEQLNGFELAGRPMKVGHVTERTDASSASSFLDSDELERTGIDLGTTGRLQLMARLAEGTMLDNKCAKKFSEF